MIFTEDMRDTLMTWVRAMATAIDATQRRTDDLLDELEERKAQATSFMKAAVGGDLDFDELADLIVVVTEAKHHCDDPKLVSDATLIICAIEDDAFEKVHGNKLAANDSE